MRGAKAEWNLNVHYHRVVRAAVRGGARTALDVGCGDGLLSFALAEMGLEVVGIDVDMPSVERACAHPRASVRTSFVCADLFNHPLERASFDVVAANAMLHHVNAEAALRRLRELVRPGGVLVVIGFANPSSPADLALIAAGSACTKLQYLRGHYWEHAAPIRWPPPLSIAEMRALVQRELPHARFRRRMSHRYSVVWAAP